MAALGEEREYVAADGAAEGVIHFRGVDGYLDSLGEHLTASIIPDLQNRGVPLEEIAVLYRNAEHGNYVAIAALAANLPFVRSDKQALVKRNSRLSRWIEACSIWVTAGWKDATPPFSRLLREAVRMVTGGGASRDEIRRIECELITFLQSGIDQHHNANSWLKALRAEVIKPWMLRSRTPDTEWSAIDEMIAQTEPQAPHGNMSLTHFSGRIEGSGRLNLSTLHSAKGREDGRATLSFFRGYRVGKTPSPAPPDSVGRLYFKGDGEDFYEGPTWSSESVTFTYKHTFKLGRLSDSVAAMFMGAFAPSAQIQIKYTLYTDGSYEMNLSGSALPNQSFYINCRRQRHWDMSTVLEDGIRSFIYAGRCKTAPLRRGEIYP
jgi:DNA helicase-2/ATP-dependent DNA helicase PcrA